MEKEHTVHIPVMLRETLDLLNPHSGGVYVDGTLGGGGHTAEIARKVGETGTVVAMDRDLTAIERTEKYLKGLFGFQWKPANIRFAHANYRFFGEALDLLKIDKIDGFLLDLGLSSDQLADRKRGFRFDSDAPLDLRFDTSEGEPANELLFRLKEKDIADLIFQYGEERFSRQIARKIAERRRKDQPVQTAMELADLVRHCIPPSRETRRIDPATRTFQALRIAVNDELGSLQNVLNEAPNRLKSGGVMAVISFHSLEDRIVKNAFRDNPRWSILTNKPIVPSDEEVERNPRARSAKLRAAYFNVTER
jgi:16S rRNA (cytosine1402-N4)-methyltransferase